MFQSSSRLLTAVISICLLWTLYASIANHPHNLAYFNELAGGMQKGHMHLLGSNLDWGQDLLYLRDWIDEDLAHRKTNVFYHGSVDPNYAMVHAKVLQIGDKLAFDDATNLLRGLKPLDPDVYYAVSVNFAVQLQLPIFSPEGDVLVSGAGSGQSNDPPHSLFQLVKRAGPSIWILKPIVEHVDARRPANSVPPVEPRPVPGYRSLAKALIPTIHGLTIPNAKEQLPIIFDRLRPKKRDGLPTLLHAWHLYGDEYKAPDNENSKDPFLKFFCDGPRASAYFGGGSVVTRTRYGGRFPDAFPWALSLDQRNTQAHPGQALSLLAEYSVAPETAFQLADGTQLTMDSFVKDLEAQFQLDGEVYWNAVTLSIYLPPRREWTNKFGQKFTFDDLAAELVRRPIHDASCAGTHGLIALTVLLRVDENANVLSPAARQDVDAYLRRIIAQLRKSALPEGGWKANWDADPSVLPVLPTDSVDHDPAGFLLATGHHLEWLMMLPKSMEVDPSLLRPACEHVLRRLWKLSEKPEWVHDTYNYCPASHAARSVRLLTDL